MALEISAITNANDSVAIYCNVTGQELQPYMFIGHANVTAYNKLCVIVLSWLQWCCVTVAAVLQ